MREGATQVRAPGTLPVVPTPPYAGHMNPEPGRSLRGETILISGGSRGIGLAIALRAARDGANVVILAKTSQPHPALHGTVHTAAAQVIDAGGQALAVVGDVRSEEDVAAAVQAAAERFGGIDAVVNNASAIDLSATAEISMKRYDLMAEVNARGTFMLSKYALPALRRSLNPHILTLSPPLNLDPKWAGAHLAYTMAKYGMSLVTLGLAEELRGDGIAVNSLWPATLIDTAALGILPGGDDLRAGARSPEIVADAAHVLLTRPARSVTGRFFTDEELLREEGITDLRRYGAGTPETGLLPDLFL